LCFGEPDCPLSVAAQMGQQEMVPIAVLNAAPNGSAPVPPRTPLVELDGDGLILSAIKPADRGEGIVLRFFEAAGAATRARVTVAGAQRIERVDLLEEHVEDLAAKDGTAILDVRPYEIVTLRAVRADD
jgi:alpha-mannosidase